MARCRLTATGNSGDTIFNENFTGSHTAPLETLDGMIKLHIIFDRSSVEVFANNGLVTMTERIFPSNDSLGLSLFSTDGTVTLKTVKIYDLELPGSHLKRIPIR